MMFHVLLTFCVKRFHSLFVAVFTERDVSLGLVICLISDGMH